MELWLQLEIEHARKEIKAELSELKQNFAPAARLSNKSTPNATTILNPLRAREKN